MFLRYSMWIGETERSKRQRQVERLAGGIEGRHDPNRHRVYTGDHAQQFTGRGYRPAPNVAGGAMQSEERPMPDLHASASTSPEPPSEKR